MAEEIFRSSLGPATVWRSIPVNESSQNSSRRSVRPPVDVETFRDNQIEESKDREVTTTKEPIISLIKTSAYFRRINKLEKSHYKEKKSPKAVRWESDCPTDEL